MWEEPEGASGNGCIAPILAAATATIRPPGITNLSLEIMSYQGPERVDRRSSSGVGPVLCQEVWILGEDPLLQTYERCSVGQVRQITET